MDVRGPAYPFRIDPATGRIAMAEGNDKISANVRIVLATRRGERPMNRNFGAGIHELLHEPNDGSLSRLIVKTVREMLMQHEPRIVVVDTKVTQQAGELVLELHYIHADRPQADVMVIRLG
jgi:phage baseplate assembly protein W